MARVRLIGVIASRLRLPVGGDVANIVCIPFAKLDDGTLAVANNNLTVGVPPDARRDTAETVARIMSPAVLGHVPQAHRDLFFSGLLEALQARDVQTDPETLSALPFEFLPDAELHEFLGL